MVGSMILWEGWMLVQMAPFADVEYDGVASTLSGELTVEGVRVRVNGYSDYLTIDRIGIDTPSFLSLVSLSDLSSKGPDAMPEYIGFLEKDCVTSWILQKIGPKEIVRH